MTNLDIKNKMYGLKVLSVFYANIYFIHVICYFLILFYPNSIDTNDPSNQEISYLVLFSLFYIRLITISITPS